MDKSNKISLISKSIWYISSSLVASLIDLVLLLLFNKIFNNLFNEHIALLLGVVISRLFSAFFNYVITKNKVFKSKGNFFKHLFKFYLMTFSTLIFNYILLDMLSIILNLNLVLSKIIVDTSMFVVNYFIQKKIIFKKYEPEKNDKLD